MSEHSLVYYPLVCRVEQQRNVGLDYPQNHPASKSAAAAGLKTNLLRKAQVNPSHLWWPKWQRGDDRIVWMVMMQDGPVMSRDGVYRAR